MGKQRLAVGLMMFLLTGEIHAQIPASSADLKIEETKKTLTEREKQARSLYQQAWELEEKGDSDGALELFRASRKIFPNKINTYNLAHRLIKKEKWDEGLEVFETLLEDFAAELPHQERDHIHQAMILCRTHVGSLVIKTSPGAQITVDGKVREAILRERPVRLLAGKHTIRVYKAGFELIEKGIELLVGQEISIDFPLQVLQDTGRLLVASDQKEEGQVLLINGNEAGSIPWVGSLKPGSYLVQIVGPLRGSLPKRVQVVAGLEVGVELETKPLRTPVRLQVNPPDALMFLEGDFLEKGNWQGRLPVGLVHLEARLEGYRTALFLLQSEEAGEHQFRLEVDEKHIKWKKIHLELEASVGWGWSPSMRGDATRSCPDNCKGSLEAWGWSAEGRVVYVLPTGLRVEGVVGYMQWEAEFERRIRKEEYIYNFQQNPVVKGPQMGVGIGYRTDWSRAWEGGAHLSVHGLFASTLETLQGGVSLGDERANIEVAGSNQVVRGFDLVLQARLSLLYKKDPWRIGLELGGGGFLTEGSVLQRGETAVPLSDTRPCSSGSKSPWCLRGRNDLFVGERAHRRFLFMLPSLLVGWSFP